MEGFTRQPKAVLTALDERPNGAKSLTNALHKATRGRSSAIIIQLRRLKIIIVYYLNLKQIIKYKCSFWKIQKIQFRKDKEFSEKFLKVDNTFRKN